MTLPSRRNRSIEDRIELAEDEIDRLVSDANRFEGTLTQHEERMRELEAAVIEFDERIERLEDMVSE